MLGSSSGSKAIMSCDTCGAGHATSQCPIFVTPSPPVETVDYVGGGPRGSGNQFGNTYNYGWRGSSNPSWTQGQSQYRPPLSQGRQYQAPLPQEKKYSTEDVLARFMISTELEARERGIPSASSDGVAVREDPNLSDDASKENGRKTVEDCPNSNISKGHEYKPVVSYPSRLKQDKDEAQFKKFLNIFKELHINIPIIEALAQMPKYAKFLKELLTNKRKLEEQGTVVLTGNCSAILEKKMPQKVKDSGSFVIPCVFGEGMTEHPLADSGASINVMPYNLFLKLGLEDLRPTQMTL
ncbi:uncharacterized protein LOC120254609 [Dioscorea cayenensis subsp. rotundata]|uniref:Uncharacterized protein LOC120254609 n=1 Tax=Dioscorea cayennensis subsp. rotundata TaxID=55577 RepID=A0AB40AUA1_DIOCR|nr:uncharacterized protein LOC120254609 [Dioscorea cayenensis subsp. rotundata]